MSELDNAMEEHMAYIVLSVGRPFSFIDFLSFKVGENEHRMTHGTFRNKIRSFKKNQVVELAYNSGIAFYTLKGVPFGKPMTPNHTAVHNDPVYNMIKNLPLDKQSIHDIRLRFSVPSIWTMLSDNPKFHRNNRSKDIVIPSWLEDNAIVKVTIHKTDTISVIIGCSLEPITLDFNGIIRFFTILARIEEKLQTILESSPVNYGKTSSSIPHYAKWTITMWHFGRDGLLEYTGEKFSITVENAQHTLTRVYSKDFGINTRIRLESQEYPKKSVFQAIEQKLSHNFESE